MNAPITLVGRSAALLRALGDAEPGGLSTTAAAAATGLARPTAHRLLIALEREGLVERDEASHQWLLGPELYLLGRRAAPRYDVTALAEPVIHHLAQLTGESAFLSARRGDQTICLLREDGSFPIRSHVLYEGIRFPLGVASAGIAILAHLGEPEVTRYLATHDLTGEFGLSHTGEAIRARVEATRHRGWALNAGHIVEGSWGMAAAVFDSGGRPRWALSLTGIEQRFTPERQTEYGRLLLDRAHALSRLMERNGE